MMVKAGNPGRKEKMLSQAEVPTVLTFTGSRSSFSVCHSAHKHLLSTYVPFELHSGMLWLSTTLQLTTTLRHEMAWLSLFLEPRGFGDGGGGLWDITHLGGFLAPQLGRHCVQEVVTELNEVWGWKGRTESERWGCAFCPSRTSRFFTWD